MVKTRGGTETDVLRHKTHLENSSEALNTSLDSTPAKSMANSMADTAHDMTESSGERLSTLHVAPAEQPQWFLEVRKSLCKIDSIDERLALIETKLKTVEFDIKEVRMSVNVACDDAKQASESAKKIENTAALLQQENSQLKNEISMLKTRIIQQESQSRRNNLIFNGIPENTNESFGDCEIALWSLFKDVLGITDGKLIKFERVHRLGRKSPHKQRAIIAKFCYFKDREHVWKLRNKLSSSKVIMSEDYPTEIIEERRALLPILKAAKNSTTVKTATLTYNKLHIDGKNYDVNCLNKLPEFLRPENIATKRGNGVTLFASKHAYLSNFYTSEPIKIDMETFCSTEQYYQAKKSLFFNDDITAAKIMSENDPYKIHFLGKYIRNCDESKWQPEACKVLLKANRAKYEQIHIAREALLSTGTDEIGEATRDPVFGIGLTINDPAAFDRSKWTGKNLFGNVLKQIRAELPVQSSFY